MFSLLSGRLSSGLAKVEEGDHIVYGNPVTSGTSGLTEATADVISSTTIGSRPIAALLPSCFAKGSRTISMHSGQVAASKLMVAA